jgi:putative phosphoribosyl transferase
MYFKSRAEAGRLLANKLKKYNDQHCAVVALTPGSILIGAQIAMRLHASLMLMLSEKINLPGEPDPIAAMTDNTFTYNHMYSAGQLEEFVGDYHGFIEGQRIEKLHQLHKLMIDGGEIQPEKLRHHIVILVSDALQNGMSLEIAADYLKPIKMKKLIIATPLASVASVDRMHLVGDEIFCLSVSENLMEADHYYDDNTIPDQTQIQAITHNIALNWQT